MTTAKDRIQATAVAPATVGNVAVGFDILGFATGVAGDRVTVRRIDEPTVRIDSITGVVTDLPRDPENNTATAGLIELREDLELSGGFAVDIQKGLPLGSGMGGSACSAVASAVAANAVIDEQLTDTQLLEYALVGESVATDSVHADNVAPALYGGLVLVPSLEPLHVVELPVPTGIQCVVVRPDLRIDTRRAREILPDQFSLATVTAQSAKLAGFLAGCFEDDLQLVDRSLEDILIEPHRSQLIPGFAAVHRAAIDTGALGASISGAGPTVFAWCKKADGKTVRDAMLNAFRDAGVDATGWQGPIDERGAYLVDQ